MAGSDLGSAHQEVLDRACAGEVAVFAAIPDDTEVPAYDDEEFWEEGTIDGGWLADLFQHSSGSLHRSGVVIVGARILGGLDLAYAELARPMTLISCQLGPHGCDVRAARTRSIRLERTWCSRVDAEDAQVAGILNLDGAHVAAGVDLNGAVVEGQVRCIASHLSGSGMAAFTAVGARIRNGVHLDRAELEGGVRLLDATIGQIFECSGARASGLGAAALDVGGARFEGSVLLEKGFIAEGLTSFIGATIAGSLYAGGARFVNPGGDVLAAGGLDVRGGISMRGVVTEGEVGFVGASIGRAVDFRRAQLHNVQGVTLRADRMKVGGSLLLAESFLSAGHVRLVGAAIGGDVDAYDATFCKPGGQAINAARLNVTGSLFITGSHAHGTLRLAGASISGNLLAHNAELHSPGRLALDALGMRAAGNVVLSEGFIADGEVCLAGASIGGDLDCSSASLLHPQGAALNATGAVIAGTLALDAGFHSQGTIVLRNATASSLRDEPASWPELIDLDGFRYRTLPWTAGRGWRSRSEWLRRQIEPSSDAYTHLASTYRSVGHDRDARKILMERHNALLQPPERWKTYLPSGWRGRLGRMWRWVLRASIGHGYTPARSLAIAMPLIVAVSVWLAYAARHDMLLAVSERLSGK